MHNIDVLVAYQTPGAVAAKQATREIPIVLLGNGDPVGTGLIANLARPGGNITGTSSQTSENGSKMLEVMRDIMPSVERAQARMLQPLKPAERKTLLALMTQLVDLNNEASRVPLRAEDALEHFRKSG